MSDLPPPIQHLGRYDITRVLGQGAMGVVYEGRDPNLDRRVAIKTVRVVGMAPQEVIEYEQRFKTEARSAGRLQHPNIVSVYDSAKHEDALGQTAYIVMEFVEGQDLKHYLDQGTRFSLEQTAFMMNDLLAALDYAHRNKIIHRDIKPANMLLTKEGRIKLTDFGVARITDSGEATKTSGGTVGTLKYMSPEQVAGKGVDSSSDLFSAGIVLYQLLTGVRPFDGEGYLDIVSKIVKQDPMPPSQIVGALPPALDNVVAKALAKSKLDRFPDAASFAAALKAAVNNADLTITPSANPIPELSSGFGTLPGSLGGGTTGSTVTQELELVYWKDIKDSDDPEILEGFLKRFPVGIYADLAKRKLKSLSDAQQAAGQGSRYEATQLRKPGEATMVSAPVVAADPTTPGSVAATVAAITEKAAAGAASDDPTLPPSAYNDSEYGASTQFAPTQFPTTEPASLELKEQVQASADMPDVSGKPEKSAKAKKKSKESTSAPPSNDGGKKSSKVGLWAGVGAVALAGAVWWGMSGSDTPAPNATSAPAAGTATQSVSPDATPTAAPTSAASTPDNTATAVTPASTAGSATASLPSGTTSLPTKATASLPARAASALRAALPNRKASGPASSPSSTHTPQTTHTEPEKHDTPKPAAPAPAPEAPRARDSATAGPREACEGRVLLGFLNCVAEQCARPVFRNHPVCVERREQEERRRAIENSRLYC